MFIEEGGIKLKKKWTFRWVSILLIFVVIASGCGNTEEDSGNEESASQESNEPVVLRAIMEQVPDSDIVQSMLEDFNQEYPDITVDIEMLPYDQMREKILSSFLAPDPVYDLIVVDNPWMYDFASEGFLEPLDGMIQEAGDAYNYEDFAAPLRQIAEVDGQTYAIPFYNYALGLIYREDLFEEHALNPPESIDELQNHIEELTTDEIAGTAMQPQRGYKIFEEWANWLFAEGGAIQDESGNIVLDSPEARNALTKYIETYNASAPEDSINWGFDEAMRAVSSGQAATMLSYNWMLPTLNNPDGAAGDLAGRFALTEVPGGKSVLGAWYWAIPANTEQKDAAWTFIEWITSPEQDLERVLNGGAPIRMSVMEEAGSHEDGFGEDYYNTVKSILENASPLADGPNAEEMIQAVGTELSEAVAGKKSVDQAITDASNKAREIMNEEK